MRSLSNQQALDWLLTTYPKTSPHKAGHAIKLIAHRSWKKQQQTDLVNAYMPVMFPNGFLVALKTFNSIMSSKNLTNMLYNLVKDDDKKLDTIRFYLPFFIRDVKDDVDKEIFTELLKKLSQ